VGLCCSWGAGEARAVKATVMEGERCRDSKAGGGAVGHSCRASNAGVGVREYTLVVCNAMREVN
jgi:hypothetical protein